MPGGRMKRRRPNRKPNQNRDRSARLPRNAPPIELEITHVGARGVVSAAPNTRIATAPTNTPSSCRRRFRASGSWRSLSASAARA